MINAVCYQSTVSCSLIKILAYFLVYIDGLYKELYIVQKWKLEHESANFTKLALELVHFKFHWKLFLLWANFLMFWDTDFFCSAMSDTRVAIVYLN